MLKSRFVLSVLAALSLSTLALANSAPVDITSLHSGVSLGVSVSDHSSVSSALNASSHLTAQDRGVFIGHSNFVQSENISSVRGYTNLNHKYQPNCCRAQSGVGVGSGTLPTQLAVPEPGSLLLLSTGLMGLAGTVRRKLQR